MQLNYEQLASFIQKLPFSMSMNECHGVLSGVIIANAQHDNESWLAHVFAEQADVDRLQEEDRSFLTSWYDFTREQLESEDLSFVLCLPDDDEQLITRVNALADWCHGFLYGLAATGDIDFAALPAEASETLSDLSEIGKVDVTEASADEDLEADLTEIIEYVRMAALSLCDDVRAQQKLQATTAFLEKTIH